MMLNKPQRKQQNAIIKHLKSIGFTNRLALYIVFLLSAGLAGGFFLANKSIVYGYTGALACYTVAFTPIGTACSIVLSKIVDKSKAENTGPNGEGITYAQAQADGFQQDERFINSPPI